MVATNSYAYCGLEGDWSLSMKLRKKLGMTRATVQSILRKYNQTGTIENSQRSGRPPKLNARDLQFLNCIVTKDAESRRTPVENITAKLDMDILTKTVRRAMKKIGISYHPAAIKPFVSKVNAKKRLDWCKEHLSWTVEDWPKVIWTNECSVEIQRSSKHTMV